MKIKGSAALVTGASRGIGRALAEELLSAGARKVYLGVRDLNSVSDFAKQRPEAFIPLQLDVTKPHHIYKAARKAVDVSILVNNAGVVYGGSLFDPDRIEKARMEMEVNYFGPMMMMREFAPILDNNGGGAILNISSIAGLVPFPDIPTYGASKAAVYFLSEEARMELKARGTHVMSVHPGPVDTDMARDYNMPKATPPPCRAGNDCGAGGGKDDIIPRSLCTRDVCAAAKRPGAGDAESHRNFRAGGQGRLADNTHKITFIKTF